jgi:hypothetical protein
MRGQDVKYRASEGVYIKRKRMRVKKTRYDPEKLDQIRQQKNTIPTMNITGLHAETQPTNRNTENYGHDFYYVNVQFTKEEFQEFETIRFEESKKAGHILNKGEAIKNIIKEYIKNRE